MNWSWVKWSVGATVWLAARLAMGAIFADFTTSHGVFTVELDALAAPRAVANFIGLADGTQTWRDPVTGAVRGGDSGEAYFSGMQFYATAGTLALLGGLRPYSGEDGNEYWEGPGYTILDEVTNGVELVRGVLALAEFMGPHSGGGELALMLTNAAYLGSGWTGFGAVTGAGMAVVDAMVQDVTNGSGRVVAQIAIRDGGITPGETAALELARQELPTLETMPLGFSRVGNVTAQVSFESVPKSQACLSTTSNLLAGSWSVLPGKWNTDTNEVWRDVPLGSIPGIGTPLGYLYGSQAVYPNLTARPWSGKMRFGMAHTGIGMQYWLDFAGATGMWARVSNNIVVENGTISWFGQELATANSVHLRFSVGITAYYYWLGLDEEGTIDGRFYCELWPYNLWLDETDSGTFETVAGWGEVEGRAVMCQRRPGPVAGVPPTFDNTMAVSSDWLDFQTLPGTSLLRSSGRHLRGD